MECSRAVATNQQREQGLQYHDGGTACRESSRERTACVQLGTPAGEGTATFSGKEAAVLAIVTDEFAVEPAASSGPKMDKDEAGEQKRTRKRTKSVERADAFCSREGVSTGSSNTKFGPEVSGTDLNAFIYRSTKQSTLTTVDTQSGSSISLDVLSGSRRLNDNVGAAEQGGVLVGFHMGTRDVCSAAEGTAPVSSAGSMVRDSAATVQGAPAGFLYPPIPSSISGEDGNKDALLSQAPASKVTSQQMFLKFGAAEQQMLKESQQHLESRTAKPPIKTTVMSEARALVEASEMQWYQNKRYQGNFVGSGMTENYERLSAEHPSADNKVDKREDKSNMLHPRAVRCPTEKNLHLDIYKASQDAAHDSGIGGRSQLNKNGAEALDRKASMLMSPLKLVLQQHGAGLETTGIPFGTVKETTFSRGTSADIREGSCCRVSELRQFTLELLYTVSLLRPCGKKGDFGDIRSGPLCLEAASERGYDKESAIFSRAAHSALLSGYPGEGQEKVHKAELNPSEKEPVNSEGTDTAASTERHIRPLIPEQMRLWQNQQARSASVDYTAALERRVSDAILLCTLEESSKAGAAAPVSRRKGSDGGFERNFSERCEGLSRREGPADAALATVACADGGPLQQSFEAFAEEIAAANTVKELVGFLCGYFGPILGLLRDHINVNRLQPSGTSTRVTQKTSIEWSSGNSRALTNNGQEVGQRSKSDLHREQQVLSEAQVDETVEGVNAILQVLTETDQSAAGAALDSVCERLFPSQHDKEAHVPSPTYSSAATSSDAGTATEQRHRHEHQPSGRTSIGYSHLRGVDDRGNIWSGRESQEPSGSRVGLCKLDIRQQSHRYENVTGISLSCKDLRTSVLSSPANDAPCVVVESKKADSDNGSDADGPKGRVADRSEVPREGLVTPRGQAIQEEHILGRTLQEVAADGHDVKTVNTPSSEGSFSEATQIHHGILEKDRAEGQGETCKGPGLESQFVRNSAKVLPPRQQQLGHDTMIRRTEVEEHVCPDSGTVVEGDESLSSRAAWLAEQLSTPLDILGGHSTVELEGERNPDVCDEVAHLLETLDPAVLQPSGGSLAEFTNVAAGFIEKQKAGDSARDLRPSETGMQIVLGKLSQQQQEEPVCDAGTALDDGCLPGSERGPKRRAVLTEAVGVEDGPQRRLTEAEQRRASVATYTKGDGFKAHERTAKRTSDRRRSICDSLLVATGHESARISSISPSNTVHDASVASVDEAAAFSQENASAAAVERAGAAAQTVATPELKSIGSAGLLRRIHDLGNASPAELTDSSLLLTSKPGASSCHAARLEVEHVPSSTNDQNEGLLAQDTRDMFAGLDNQGLDRIISQLLKLAGRGTIEQGREEGSIYEKHISVLLNDVQRQVEQEYESAHQGDFQQDYSSNSLRPRQHEPYQQDSHRPDHRKGMMGKGDRARSGSSGNGTPVRKYSFPHGISDASRTSSATPSRLQLLSRMDRMGEFSAAAGTSYSHSGTTLPREETATPARLRLDPDRCSEVSSISALPPHKQSSQSLQVPRGTLGLTGKASLPPADSPLASHSGRHLSETPGLSVTGSACQSRRQSNIKRSPWRSYDPCSSSASTVAATPATASAQSFGSSSLSSSPFSLLPISAAAFSQHTGAALEGRAEDIGDTSIALGSEGISLAWRGRGGLEDTPRESLRYGKDICKLTTIRWDEDKQRRLSLEGTPLPISLLPPRVCSTDSSSISSSTTVSKGAFGTKTQASESFANVKVEQDSGTGASLYAQLRASDFVNVSASARAHLLEEASSSTVPVLRCLSAVAPPVSVTPEGGGGSAWGQHKAAFVARRVQAEETAEQALAKEASGFYHNKNVLLSAFPHERGHGGVSYRKAEGAPWLAPRLRSSGDRRSLSASGRSLKPGGLPSSDFSRFVRREGGRRNVETEPAMTDEQPCISTTEDQQAENAEGGISSGGSRREATDNMVSRIPDDHERCPLDATIRTALGHSRTHSLAGPTRRTGLQQQHQNSNDIKEFSSESSVHVDKGLLRSRCLVGGRQDERNTGGRYCATTSVSSLFARSTLSGIRNEVAAAGCVGAGGADCVCGGAVCLYRSAVSGVVYDKSGQKWTARWNEDGRQHKRTFAAAKYGFFTAKQKAETCRGEARERAARAKHEAIQRQQESIARQLETGESMPPAGDGGPSQRCIATSSHVGAAARVVAEQRKMRP